MANGTHKITEKEMLPTIHDADSIVCVSGGKVYRSPVPTLGDIGIQEDEQSGGGYLCKLLIRDGHLVVQANPTGCLET